jgi:hypothetical protein
MHEFVIAFLLLPGHVPVRWTALAEIQMRGTQLGQHQMMMLKYLSLALSAAHPMDIAS